MTKNLTENQELFYDGFNPHLPFGGGKDSGYGREAFVDVKSIQVTES